MCHIFVFILFFISIVLYSVFSSLIFSFHCQCTFCRCRECHTNLVSFVIFIYFLCLFHLFHVKFFALYLVCFCLVLFSANRLF